VPYSTPFCAGKYKQEQKIIQSAKAEFLAYSEFFWLIASFKRVQKVQKDKGHMEVIHWSRADFSCNSL